MSSLNTYVKVYLISGKNTKIGYIDIKRYSNDEQIREALAASYTNLKTGNWRYYWKDGEGDEIDIFDRQSAVVFWKGHEDQSKSKKLFVEEIRADGERRHEVAEEVFVPTTENRPASAAAATSTTQEKGVLHPGVMCDGCDSQVFGYRYKCVQCPDYDLCMTCEGKLLHPEHVMFRIPVPFDRLRFDRRTLRKMKKGHFGCNDNQNSGGEESWHNRHHRKRHCNRNFLTNLYTMMHDLAEGTEGPAAEPDVEAQQAPRPTSAENRSGNGTTTPQQETGPSFPFGFGPAGFQTPPAGPIPGCPIFPGAPPAMADIFGGADAGNQNYAQAGIQILNNFSQMFAKMLDPLGINVEVDIGLKNPQSKTTETGEENKEKPAEQSSSAGPSSQSEAANGQQQQRDEPKSNEQEPQVEKIQEPQTEKAPEPVANPEPTAPMEWEPTGVASSSAANVDAGKSTDRKDWGPSESGWTLVDRTVEPKTNEDVLTISSESPRSSKESSPTGNPHVEANKIEKDGAGGASKPNSAHSSKESSPSTGRSYAQVSKDLWNFIQKENPNASVPPEKRAQIVYHRKQHINNAVIAMMAMGFSNDENWLTQLLETVDGDIARALDLLQPAK